MRNLGLDYLRFLLSLSVMAFHFLWFGPMHGFVSGAPLAGDWLQFGPFAVSAFFVVSGLVIAWSAEGRSWQRFASARIARLWPSMAICATLTAVGLLLSSADAGQTGRYWAKSVLLLPMVAGGKMLDGSYWSIAQELRFYALVAVVLALGQLRRLPEILTLAVIAGWLCRLADLDPLSEALIWQHGGFFALGVLLWRWLQEGLSPLLLALVPVNLALATAGGWWDFGKVDILDGARTALPSILPIALACVIAVALAFRLNVPRRQARLAALLGGISYPLYLLHQTLGYIWIAVLDDWLGQALATFATMLIMIAAALLIHLWAERPLTPRVRRLVAAALTRLPAPPARAA